ncbi:MAG TPA: hypothetical protein VGC55_17970 [Dokdonella sp.]
MSNLCRSVFAGVLAAAMPGLGLACSSCGCTLNSDWASQGYSVGAGLRIDLRYDYFNQSDLRSGTDSVERAALEVPNEEEIQRTTVNRNTTLGIDYAPSRAWGVNVQLPYFDRFHSTLAEGDTDLSYSHSHGIGDARVVGRYQGFSADASFGVLFGVKLPTGRTDTHFYAGPQAGERVDAGLQAGTGTTDALIGVYDFGNLTQSLGYFAQAVLQQPLASHDQFKPGSGLNLNAGFRYTAWRSITPQLQVNVRSERRESGANADIPNSGATLAYLSPGINIRFNRHWDGYVYMQLPVYQRVNGLQLEPNRSYSIGVQYHL